MPTARIRCESPRVLPLSPKSFVDALKFKQPPGLAHQRLSDADACLLVDRPAVAREHSVQLGDPLLKLWRVRHVVNCGSSDEVRLALGLDDRRGTRLLAAASLGRDAHAASMS